MAHIIADRVMESSTSSGTGIFALAGAALGYRTFSAVCAIADTVPYYIEAVDSLGALTGDWEYGLGTYNASNQLTRTTVRGSSNGGSAVNFSAGTKIVGLGVPAPNSSATRSEWLDALGALGSGQTWQSLTGSRAINTTYTNTTARPIAVSASVNGVVATSTLAVAWTIAGVTSIGINVITTGATPANSTLAAFAIVPPGATYVLAVTQGALQGWAELR